MNETRAAAGELDQLIARAQANLATALPARTEAGQESDGQPFRPLAWTEWVEWIEWVQWVQR
jgi:hypothetical protein